MRLTVRMKDPLYDVRDRYAASCNIPEYNDYTGDVVPRFPWLDDNWFVMTTGDKESPFRVLHKDSIICGWPVAKGKSEPEPTYVCIPGKSGKKYTVALSDAGHLSCNCTGYGYRRTCSHVKEVEEIL